MDQAPSTKYPDDLQFRRNNAYEAFRLFLLVFAISVLARVGWDAAFEETVDYADSFWRSLAFAPAFAVLSMVFKITPVPPR